MLIFFNYWSGVDAAFENRIGGNFGVFGAFNFFNKDMRVP